MNLFNSLGSNYNIKFALRSIVVRNRKQYEDDLKSYLRKKYEGKPVLFYKGREAIEFALRSLNLAKDSCVAFNGYTCYAVYKSITNVGLKPHFLDIDNESLNFSPEQLQTALGENPKIKALIIQNTLGYPCQIENIAKLCKANHVILIEDLAHSVGTVYENGKEAGTIGDFVVLSFSRDKIIDAISGGGLIIRNRKYQGSDLSEIGTISKNQELIDRFYPIFTYLIRKTYFLGLGRVIHKILKKLSLLPKLVEADEGEQMRRLPYWQCHLIRFGFKNLTYSFSHRKKIANIYAKNLFPEIVNQTMAGQIGRSANLRFPIFVASRQTLIEFLKKNGVNVSDIWYDAPIAPARCMSLTDYASECPNAEALSSEMLNLPTHQNVSESQAEFIVKKINLWMASK